MPATLAHTGSQETVSKYADHALHSPAGIAVHFLTTDHGSLVAAHSAARGFTSTFSALRARQRRIAQRQRGDTAPIGTDTFARGPYDRLVCAMIKTEEGYSVHLKPTTSTLDLPVTDLATGQRVDFAALDATTQRGVALLERQRRHEALTSEERTWLDTFFSNTLNIAPTPVEPVIQRGPADLTEQVRTGDDLTFGD